MLGITYTHTFQCLITGKIKLKLSDKKDTKDNSQNQFRNLKVKDIGFEKWNKRIVISFTDQSDNFGNYENKAEKEYKP